MKYTVMRDLRGGFRFDIENPPEPGTDLMTTSGEAVTFDEVSFAGMLACTRKSDDVQQLYMPQQLVMPNV